MFIFEVLEISLSGLTVRVESFTPFGLGSSQPRDAALIACSWRVLKGYNEIFGLGLTEFSLKSRLGLPSSANTVPTINAATRSTAKISVNLP
jgi:hypothetical protein